MTLEQLFDLPSDKLKAMSDEELHKYFDPYFDITRPERAVKAKAEPAIAPDMQLKLKQLAALGITVTAKDLNKRKK